MKTKLLEQLESVLKTISHYWNDEELLRTRVVEDLNSNNEELIEALLTNNYIKEKYTQVVGGVTLFNKDDLKQLLAYKDYWHDSYTKYSNSIGLTSDGKFLEYNSDVVLDFPFKDCVLEGGMTHEDVGKEEVYFNEVIARDEIDTLLSPKVFTNSKRYSEGGVEESITEIKESDNLIIKGNNLLALHSLKERYAGKVKLIYIDPPYNTGSDSFKYNDRFNRSTWLTFMKNRLEIAKELLNSNGLIFVHIGDKELHYLKILMDSIYGEGAFIATIPRKTRNGKTDVPYKLSQDYDWILIYTNTTDKRIPLFQREIERNYYQSDDYPDDKWRLSDLTKQTTTKERPKSDFTLVNPKNGEEFPVNPNRSWAITIDTVDDYLMKDKIVFPGDYDFLNIRVPSMRTFLSEEIKQKGELFNKTYVSTEFVNKTMDVFLNQLTNRHGNDELIKLFGNKNFSFPKPEILLQMILEYCTNENDLILDFFMGSGTTQAVAHKMNRQYIGIEQMDYINEVSVPRLQKVIEGEQGGISKEVEWQGGGSFVYTELKELNQTYIKMIQGAQDSDELLSIFAILKDESSFGYSNAYFDFKADIDKLAKDLYEVDGLPRKQAFQELELHDQKRLLIETLDKNQLYVNYAEMNDASYQVSEADKAFTHSFYGKDEA